MINKFKQTFFSNLPLINFCISFSALTFQITVLNPWHSKISKQIKIMDNKITKST